MSVCKTAVFHFDEKAYFKSNEIVLGSITLFMALLGIVLGTLALLQNHGFVNVGIALTPKAIYGALGGAGGLILGSWIFVGVVVYRRTQQFKDGKFANGISK